MKRPFSLRSLHMLFWTLAITLPVLVLVLGAASAGAQGNIVITNDAFSQQFFYSMTASNESVPIMKVELQDGNIFPA